MKYQKVKVAVILVCVLAAGICYSCGKEQKSAEYGDFELPASASTGMEGDFPESTGEEKVFSSEEETQTEPETQKVSVCYVHICGEVADPGVYEMEEGSRIFQVVEQAGGFTERAASEYLNMAQLVTDGMKLVVPDITAIDEAERFGIVSGKENSGDGNAPNGAGTAVTAARVNLNTASKEELMTLKGIGESKADDIISYRESRGGFLKIEDIMKISGIKNAAFEKIKDDITV